MQFSSVGFSVGQRVAVPPVREAEVSLFKNHLKKKGVFQYWALELRGKHQDNCRTEIPPCREHEGIKTCWKEILGLGGGGASCWEGALHVKGSGEQGTKNPDECPQGWENPFGLEDTQLRLLVLVLCIKSVCSDPHFKSLESSSLGLRLWKGSASTGDPKWR